MQASDVKRLKEPEDENARLRQLLTEADKAELDEAICVSSRRETPDPGSQTQRRDDAA